MLNGTARAAWVKRRGRGADGISRLRCLHGVQRGELTFCSHAHGLDCIGHARMLLDKDSISDVDFFC